MDHKPEDTEVKNKGIFSYQISTKASLIFYGCLLGGLILFIAILSIISSPVTIDDMRKISTSPPRLEQKHELMPGSVANNPQYRAIPDIKITTSMERRGNYLVITTRAKNEKSYPVKEKLGVYVIDSTGGKHFIDQVYIELNNGETGNAESSKKIDDIGPPPYKVVTEWK